MEKFITKSIDRLNQDINEIQEELDFISEQKKENKSLDEILKAFSKKDITKLRAVKKLIIRDGKAFMTTVYVKDGIEVETPRHKKVAEEKELFDVKYKLHDFKIGDFVLIEPKYPRKGGKSVHSGVVDSIGYDKKRDEYYLSLNVEGKDGYSFFKINKSIITKHSFSKEETKKEDSSVKTFDELYDSGTSLGGSSDVRLISSNGIVLKKFRSDKSTGKEQLITEHITNRIYNAIYSDFTFGNDKVFALSTKLEDNNKYLSSRFLKDYKTLRSFSETSPMFVEVKEELRSSFVLDALFANRDVIGADFDNILFSQLTREIKKVDNGSSFVFRAMGGIKEFTNDCKEIDTLRDSDINSSSAKIYGDLTDKEIADQIRIILSDDNGENFLNIISKTIKQSTDSLTKGDLTSFEPEWLIMTLKNRLQYLKNRFIKEEKPTDKGIYESEVTNKFFADWDTLEIDIPDEFQLKETVKRNIIKIEKENESKYNQFAKDNNLTVEEYKQKLQNSIEEFVKDIEFFRCTDSEHLPDIVNDGRWKSQFETDKSHGAHNPSYRNEVEKIRFGFDNTKIEKEKRPIYGYFSNDKNGTINGKGIVPPRNYVSSYGDVICKIKKEKGLKQATFTMDDSLTTLPEDTANFMVKPHFTAFQVKGYAGDPLIKIKERKNAGTFSPKYGSLRNSYVEVQYHNGLTINDVESIHISKELLSDKSLNKALDATSALVIKNNNVKIRVF